MIGAMSGTASACFTLCSPAITDRHPQAGLREAQSDEIGGAGVRTIRLTDCFYSRDSLNYKHLIAYLDCTTTEQRCQRFAGSKA